jgi:excinuclease ABC subunit A
VPARREWLEIRGAAERIKLSRELSKAATGRTLYILDEPTTGLHFDDLRKLLHVLGRLVDAGNAGGPGRDDGDPEAVAACEASHTGRFRRRVL